MLASRKTLRLIPLTLQGKLVLMVGVVLFVALGLMSVVHFQAVKTRDARNIALQLTLISDLNAASTAAAVRHLEDELSLLASAPSLTRFAAVPKVGLDPASRADPNNAENERWLQAYFTAFLAERPYISRIALTGRNGRTLTASNDDPFTASAALGIRTPYNQPHTSHQKIFPENAEPGSLYFQVRSSPDRTHEPSSRTTTLIRPVFQGAIGIVGALEIDIYLPNIPIPLEASGGNITTNISQHLVALPDDTPPSMPSSALSTVRRTTRNIVVASKSLSAGDSEALILRLEANYVAGRGVSAAVSEFERVILMSLILIGCAMVAAISIGNRLVAPLARLRDWVGNLNYQYPQAPGIDTADDDIGEFVRTFASLSEGLATETSKVRAIFSNVPCAIIVLDGDGKIVEMNPAAESIFENAHHGSIGDHIVCLMPRSDTDALCRAVNQAAAHEGRNPITLEIEHYQETEDILTIEITISSTDSFGASQIILIARDVTEDRRSNQRVENLITALERSNSELDQFAYVASHDLKAPLRVIENASLWLAEDLEPHLTDDTRETLTLLQNRVSRMRKLLDDLLAHSRIGATGSVGAEVSGDILIRDIISLLDIPEGFKLAVSDTFKKISVPLMPLKMVLLNLVSNAIKHHDRDTGTIRIEASVSCGEYQFTISDDGPGIAPEYHRKVFELFQTLKPRDVVDSSGMGLAMVRKQVDLVGGTVTLTSDGKRGSTFTVGWPIEIPVPQLAERQAS